MQILLCCISYFYHHLTGGAAIRINGTYGMFEWAGGFADHVRDYPM